MKKPRKRSIKIKDIGEIDKLIDNMVDDYMKKFYEQITVIKNKLTILNNNYVLYGGNNKWMKLN